MKITVYYEKKSQITILDVPDADCEIWIETDYQSRLSAAKDKSSVTRRTAQEIMDEECNKRTFNNNQTETRRHVHLEALDPQDDTIVGTADLEGEVFKKEKLAALHHAISKLSPKQRDLLRKVFWEEIKQSEIAKAQGVSESAISQRMAVIYARLHKLLDEKK